MTIGIHHSPLTPDSYRDYSALKLFTAYANAPIITWKLTVQHSTFLSINYQLFYSVFKIFAGLIKAAFAE